MSTICWACFLGVCVIGYFENVTLIEMTIDLSSAFKKPICCVLFLVAQKATFFFCVIQILVLLSRDVCVTLFTKYAHVIQAWFLNTITNGLELLLNELDKTLRFPQLSS